MSPQDPGVPDLFESRELRAVVAAFLAVVALVVLLLTIARDRTDLLYDDLGRWEISAIGRDVPRQAFRKIQPRGPERPFRLVLALDRIPRAGDAVVAERSYRVDPSGLYCFEVFATSEYFNPDSPQAIGTFRTGVAVNGRRVAWFPLADRRRTERVRALGIRPADGRIDVRFEVRALADREKASWQKASEVVFEFARLYRCGDAGEADRH